MPRYRFLEEEPKVEQKLQQEQIPQKGKFRFLKEDEHPEEISSVFGVPFKDIARQGAQYTARGLETLAGLPGDIYQAAKTLSEYFPELPSFLQGQESFVSKGLKKAGETLPTSQELRGLSKEVSQGFLEPKTETEKGVGEFVSDLTSLKAGGFGLLKAAGTSLVGNLIAPVVKQATGSEKLGENTKNGLYLVSAMIKPGAAREYGQQKLKNAYQAIPEGETILTTRLDRNLKNFLTEIEKGGITPAKQPAYRLAKRLEKAPSGNTLDVLELPATRNSINEYRFEKELNPKAHRWLNKFDDIINKELTTYGKANPEFLSNYREGNEILANVHQGNRVTKFISKALGTKEIKPETLLLLGLHSPKGLGAAGGVAGLSSVYNIGKRLTKPTFRKHYYNTLNSALKENVPVFLKNVKKLDDSIQKENK